MKTKTIAACLTVLVAMATGTSSAWAQRGKPAPQAELTETGRKLEDIYTTQLQALKTQIADSLPTVNERSKAAYLKAREAEKAAEAKLTAAQNRQGELGAAQAMVAHAKGKWIGGADKGIAEAKAKLEQATTDAERTAAREELAKWQNNRETRPMLPRTCTR